MRYTVIGLFIIVSLVLLVISCEDESSISCITPDSTDVLLADTFKCCFDSTLWELDVGYLGHSEFWQDSLFYICAAGTPSGYAMVAFMKSRESWSISAGDIFMLTMNINLEWSGLDTGCLIGMKCDEDTYLGLGFMGTDHGTFITYFESDYTCIPAGEFLLNAQFCDGYLHKYQFIISQDSVSFFVDEQLLKTTVKTLGCDDSCNKFQIFIQATGYYHNLCIAVERIKLERYLE